MTSIKINAVPLGCILHPERVNDRFSMAPRTPGTTNATTPEPYRFNEPFDDPLSKPSFNTPDRSTPVQT